MAAGTGFCRERTRQDMYNFAMRCIWESPNPPPNSTPLHDYTPPPQSSQRKLGPSGAVETGFCRERTPQDMYIFAMRCIRESMIP